MAGEFSILPIGERAWRFQEETVRCFLFVGQKRALLVDTGKDLTDLRTPVSQLTDLPVTVVNTHTDIDHIACNAQFPTVLMSPAEYHLYHRLQGRGGDIRPVWDGERLDLGGRSFQVLETPGHTSGSISLLDRENRILVGGDGIQDGTVYMFGEGRDLLAYCHSLERLDRLRESFDTVYPSHGSFPVPASLIPELLAGVREILAGKGRGAPREVWGIPVTDFDCGCAHLLVDREAVW